jgi:competence protein ComEC
MEKFWHQAPLVRILLPFLLGILSGLEIEVDWTGSLFWLLLPLLTIWLVLFWDKPWRALQRNKFFGVLHFIFFFFLGYFNSEFHENDPRYDIPDSRQFSAYISSNPEWKKNSLSFQVKTMGYADSLGNFQPWKSELIAYVAKEDSLAGFDLGREIHFFRSPTEPSEPLNPMEFDFGQYLKSKGISGTVFLRDGEFVLSDEWHGGLKIQLIRWQNALIDRLGLRSDSPAAGVLAALLLGKREAVDIETRTSFADSGTVHVLAVSGLHVGIIYLFFTLMLSRLGIAKRAPILTLLLTLLFLWIYAGITGFSPSVLRASTMFSFVAIGKQLNRFGNIYNMIAASAILLLALNPFLVFQVGFQLSYLAVLGIVYLHPKIYALWEIDHWLGDKIWSLVVVSFCAQLATFPLSVYYFHQFPTYFLISNILVIPLATAILYTGMVWLSLSWLPYISDMLGKITLFFADSLTFFVRLIQKLPLSVVDNMYFSGTTVCGVYILIIAVTAFLVKPVRRRFLFAASTSLVLTALLCTGRFTTRQQKLLIFPSIQKTNALIYVERGEAHVLAEDSLIAQDQLNYRYRTYFTSLGIRRIKYYSVEESLPSDLGLQIEKSLNGSEITEGKRFIWLKGCHTSNMKLHENVEIVQYSTKKSRCHERDSLIHFHNPLQDGAFIADLREGIIRP